MNAPSSSSPSSTVIRSVIFLYAMSGKWLNPNSCALAFSQVSRTSPFRRSVAARFASLADTESSTSEEVIPIEIKVPKKFVPFPFEYHRELTLTVSSLTNLGIGICRTTLTDHDTDNWVVFVPNVIPDEVVVARIYRNHKTYSDADLIRVVRPDPVHRVERPTCPLSMECGGCQYQHISIEKQREMKRDQMSELLERIGEIPTDTFEVLPTLGTDEVFHYRSKMTPHYDAPKKEDHIRAIGFKKKQNRQILDVDYCPIATEAINDKFKEERLRLQEETKAGILRRPNKGATILLRDTDQGVITDHNLYVTAAVQGLTFRFLAGNFFQNNPFMLPIMVDKVREAATAPSARGDQMTHLIDCYCGSGLFCLTCADSFQQCVGIEVNAKAVEEAQYNANANNIRNCGFVAASAEAIFETDPSKQEIDVTSFPRDNTVIIIDPPRKGCSEEFLEQLSQFKPQRVVYMSCDPATQARDAKFIVGEGYSIVSAQPFDLFPQTRHIESLVVFEREPGSETHNVT